MNVKACLVLSLATLLIAVCVSADQKRAHEGKVKGALKNSRRMYRMPRGAADPDAKAEVAHEKLPKLRQWLKTGELKVTVECQECINACNIHCQPSPDNPHPPSNCATDCYSHYCPDCHFMR